MDSIDSMDSREQRMNTVAESLLRDENHPDPAKAEFNRRWNEQVLKDSTSSNKANPFGGMSDRAIQDEMYLDAKNASTYKTTDDLIKDFTTKASSSQADEAGSILKDIFDKTDFANKQFDIPGSTRLVTGSDVLGRLSGIEMTDEIGSVAAYRPESGRMQINSKLLGLLQPNEIATTFTHELFHAAADASGSLDAEILTRATSARSAMTLEDAKYIGEQEGIADSFSKRTNARSWLYPRA